MLVHTHEARIPSPSKTKLALLVVAGLSVGAAAVHAAVIPEHIKEYWPFAAFFAALALFQAGWALAVVRHPSDRLYLIGAVASAALVALWAVSRTSGLPLGPEPWRPEPVARLDVVASILEAGIILVVLNRRLMTRQGARSCRGSVAADQGARGFESTGRRPGSARPLGSSSVIRARGDLRPCTYTEAEASPHG